MAKKSAMQKDLRRRRMIARFSEKRKRLKGVARDHSLPQEQRFSARLALAAMPRNGSPTRARNRCLVTGRPRGYYRKLKMSRISLRELASGGHIPGMVKSSW